MVARTNGVEYCSKGRMLGPDERAAVIRSLEMQVLAAEVVRRDMCHKWLNSAERVLDLSERLALARLADEALKEAGK